MKSSVLQDYTEEEFYNDLIDKSIDSDREYVPSRDSIVLSSNCRNIESCLHAYKYLCSEECEHMGTCFAYKPNLLKILNKYSKPRRIGCVRL